MKEKDSRRENVKVCSSCGRCLPEEDTIVLDGEYLCKDCFYLIEASKDTH